MHLERLELADYRNYATARLDVGAGVRVLVGANAQGKTNLLEAVHYLAIGSSHRVAADAPLVRAGTNAAVIRAVARTGDRRAVTIELELRPKGRNRIRCNGQPQPRVRDAIGIVRSVLFAPEDLALVRGDPSDRRRFLDDLLIQRRPAYLAARQEYERILKQRNALLKQARQLRRAAEGSLATWTDALVRAGATLVAARIAVTHALAGPADAAYRDLVAQSPSTAPPEPGGSAERIAINGDRIGIPNGSPHQAPLVGLTYLLSTGRRIVADPTAGVPAPAELAEELRAGLAEVADAEAQRGMTLAGPHRDELELAVGALPAKGYASHGEQWSLALALRLASREVLHEVGEEPIVLLDDVFAELDEDRRRRLAARCQGFEQVLVTAAVDADVPLAGPRHAVLQGTVTTAPVEVGPGEGGASAPGDQS